ncbi:phosphotransferase [Ilumatobacter nonamiensis]|uniref:phosphotransferase n=1 Tax=Ilumatobacter nonamiensis TaxID=467093 RepID=UPI00034DD959|nr:phosphotransferase [Ilumatobacter nonamiensis]
MPGLFRRRPRPEPPFIPQRPHELTAEWFTEIIGTDATVTDVRQVEIGTNVGFMGEVHRCHLTWDRVDGGLPDSVIVKVPTQVDENFAAGDALQSYEREIVVYQELAPSLGLPLPRYLYGAMDPDPAPWLEKPVRFLFEHLPLRGVNWLIGRFLRFAGKSKRRYILVLEDIVDARAPAQMVGGSFDDAAQALEVLARFHAANWMRTDAAATYHRIWPMNRASKVFQASYLRNRDHFIEQYGAVVDDSVLAHLDDIQTRVPEISDALAEEPWTLLHGDYRLDNLLFRPNGEIVVLDLQGLGSGRPAVDVAYFITTALTAEHCAEEVALLRVYHDALVEAGITGYSFDQLRRDCDLTKEMLAHRIVGSADVLDTSIDGKQGALMDMMQLRVLAWLG